MSNTEFSQGYLIIIFFFWIFVVIFQNRITSSQGKHIYLWLWLQSRPNIARVMKTVIFLSLFPSNLLSYNYNPSRTWNLDHSRQKQWLKRAQHPNNKHRKHRGKTSHIHFFHRFFSLYCIICLREKIWGSFLLVQCVIDFLWEFL